MLVVPTSRIILLKTPMELDNNNQLTFSNATAQYNYFYNLPKLECDNATYQRKDDVVRFPTDSNLNDVTFEDLLTYNYCMYQNTAWDNKWFYAYIRNITFDNIGMSLIELETDIWQSWMFDVTFKQTFVEREHVNNDNIGLHTVPENLDTGEFIINDYGILDDYGYDGHVFIGVTSVPAEIQDIIIGTTSPFNAPITQYNGIYNGLTYIAFLTAYDASQFIYYMDLNGKADDIVNVFIVPLSIYELPVASWNTKTVSYSWGSISMDLSFNYKKIPNSLDEVIMADNKTVSINNTLNGYTPKNNKMFTKEFNYLYVTNNNGGDITYAYEDFTNNTPKFRIIGAICPGCSIRLTPLDFKKYSSGTNNKNDLLPYGLTGGKYPVCSWRSDTYTNWLTQNSVNVTLSKLGDASSVAIGSAINPYLGAVAGFNLITDSIQRKVQRETTPVQAKGNINVGDVTFSAGKTNFCYFKMSCRSEYAKICDDYLSMYGYKVNSLKIPNITGRTNWNYVKTINCNIIGDIPQNDLQKIKDMFNNGVTMWHNPSTFLDYSQSNNIVS